MTSRLIPAALTGENDTARLGRSLAWLLLLMALVAALALYMLWRALPPSSPARPDDGPQQARLQAQALLGQVGETGLLGRQILLLADGPALQLTQARLGDAQVRAAELEQALRAHARPGDSTWLATLLDEATQARRQTTELLGELQRQGRVPVESREARTSAELQRSLIARLEVAEARWRSQVEEMQRQFERQAQAQRSQAEQARQRQLLEFFAWAACALVAAGWLAWSALQRVRGALERSLRRVESRDPGAEPSAARARARPADAARRAVGGADRPGAAGVQPAAATASADPAAATPPPGSDWSTLDRLAGALSRAGRVPAAPAAPAVPAVPAAPEACAASDAVAGANAAVADSAVTALPAQGAVTVGGRSRETLMREAVSAATRGGLVVSQVVANMEDIGATGRRIAETVALIDSIAFQTNLLALNAVIEAAHSEAGEATSESAQGAAADVRNLAQRATQAAREIRALIAAGSPAGSSGSADAATTALQADASQTMEALLASVQQAAELVTQLRRAADADTPAMARSLAQLDHMERNHAALVERSAASAEALRVQAERLQKVLAAFRLLQQTQQAAWGAHSAIRVARDRARLSDRGETAPGGLGALDADGPGGPANGDSAPDGEAPGGWRPF
ncbi:MAG: methyl-accepting chemotaxis protein [Burkholderiaceae bacterium]|nr:methyl-accepting chemotaxis protein [Burkholderiaceae bacterium]